MRRTAILLALVLPGSLLSACGKAGYVVTVSRVPTATTPGTTGTQPAPSGQRAPSRPPARARALAFARAVNLTGADVPGFTVSPEQHGETAGEHHLEQEFRACLGARSPRALGTGGAVVESGSPSFELKRGIIHLSVSSDVSVARSSAEAAGVLPAIHSPRVRECVSHYVTQLLQSQRIGDGARVAGVSIATGTPPAPGTSGGFGWRITATLTVRGIQLSFYLDILGFVDGPAQVTLYSSSVLRPFPAGAQEQLFSELLARAKAHSL